MIHSSYYKPRVYPYNGNIAPAEIDRLQDLSGSTTLNRTKINEIGRDGVVGWNKGLPSVSLTLKQLEYGNLEFFNKVTNDDGTALDLNDFKTSAFDIAGYKTDDNGTFLGTILYPKQRISGFSLNIGDPDALIERGFTTVGEDNIVFTDNNKYLIELESTDASGAGHQIVIGSGGLSTYPDPVALPDESGAKYFIRALRVRSGVTTELTEGTDFTFTALTGLITIPLSEASDLYKFYYTATTYISGADPFVNNDTDLAGIKADCVSIYLQTSNYVYRLQSVAIDVSFDRQDIKEIGNSEVVSRGVRDKTVKITLGRILEDNTIEQILRGVSAGYGQYDVREFQDNIKLTVKIYSSSKKTTFKMGYSFTNLSPTNKDEGVPTKDYVTQGNTLEGESATITSVEGSL